jgi:hypothetical protein
MKTYDAEIAREGRWWMISVPAIDGLTQTRRLCEAEQMARELIAVTLDVKLSDVAVNLHKPDIAGVPSLAERIDQIHREKAEAARLEAESVEQTRNLARDLVKADIPLRDAAQVLGVSYQRVHQLANN